MTENVNLLPTVRRLILCNVKACRAVFRMGNETETGVESVLNDCGKLIQILKSVTRLKMDAVENLLRAIALPTDTPEKATYDDVQTVLMQVYVLNRKNG